MVGNPLSLEPAALWLPLAPLLITLSRRSLANEQVMGRIIIRLPVPILHDQDSESLFDYLASVSI
jgi:hypothetical protein